MFREFFLSSNPLRCAWAWFGLCINFFMVVFYVWNSLRMNRWQGEFYDAVGTVKRLGLSHEEAPERDRSCLHGTQLLYGSLD